MGNREENVTEERAGLGTVMPGGQEPVPGQRSNSRTPGAERRVPLLQQLLGLPSLPGSDPLPVHSSLCLCQTLEAVVTASSPLC